MQVLQNFKHSFIEIQSTFSSLLTSETASLSPDHLKALQHQQLNLEKFVKIVQKEQ